MDEQPSVRDSITNAMEQVAAASGPVHIISSLHGPVGTFNSRAEAIGFAKQQGIPIGPASNPNKTGYFIKPIPIIPGNNG